MDVISEEQINKINETLENLTTYLDNLFEELQKEMDAGSQNAQERVDQVGDIVNEKLNTKLNEIRSKIIEIFKGQVAVIKEKIRPIEPLVNASVSMDTVVSIVQTLIEIQTMPYQPYIELLTKVMPPVLQLSQNIMNIASYSPSLNLPEGINPPEIEVDIQPITQSDIM